MAENNKKYNYEVPGHVVFEAIKATNEEFEELKDDFESHGIKRLSPEKINQLYPGLLPTYTEGLQFTIFDSASILPNGSNDLAIVNLNNNPNLIFVNCKFPKTSFRNIQKTENNSIEQFNRLIIKDSELSQFSITNSEFHGIELKNVDFGFFSLQYEVHIDYLHFINSSSNATLFLTNDCDISSLYFEEFEINSVVIETSSVESMDLNKASIRNGIHCRHNSSFEKINIKDESVVGIAQFNESKCSELRINNSSVSEVSIKKNCYFHKILFLESIANKFTALNSEIDNIDGVDDVSFNYLEFYNCNIKSAIFKNIDCDVHLTKSNFSQLYISDSTIGLFNIGPNSNFNTYVIDSDVSYLVLNKLTINQASSLSFSNVAFFAAFIEETDILGRAHFRSITSLSKRSNTSDFEIDFSFGYENHSKIYNKIKEVKSSLFKISYSSLGTTEFIDCELSSFQSFQFNNSRITEIFISGGSLPDKNISIVEVEKNSLSWNEQMVSLNNQFSSVFQRQGHIYESVNYRSKSAEYQMEVLKRKKDCLNLIPFKLNSWSNQHGASWVKSLWFIGWTAALLYLAALFSTGNLFKISYSFEPTFIGYYFDFLNPLRPFDFYKQIGLEVNGWTRLIDLLSRVVIGYGIYQLIAAFRRYGRK